MLVGGHWGSVAAHAEEGSKRDREDVPTRESTALSGSERWQQRQTGCKLRGLELHSPFLERHAATRRSPRGISSQLCCSASDAPPLAVIDRKVLHDEYDLHSSSQKLSSPNSPTDIAPCPSSFHFSALLHSIGRDPRPRQIQRAIGMPVLRASRSVAPCRNSGAISGASRAKVNRSAGIIFAANRRNP